MFSLNLTYKCGFSEKSTIGAFEFSFPINRIIIFVQVSVNVSRHILERAGGQFCYILSVFYKVIILLQIHKNDIFLLSCSFWIMFIVSYIFLKLFCVSARHWYLSKINYYNLQVSSTPAGARWSRILPTSLSRLKTDFWRFWQFWV